MSASPPNWRRIRARLAGAAGAIDLASIMVGVIVVAVISAVAFAAVNGVIPWSQDKAAQESLQAVKTAQSVARAQYEKYLSSTDLVDKGLLPKKVLNLADGSIAGGRGASVAPHIVSARPDPGTPAITVNTDGTCFVTAVLSSTGSVYWLSSESPSPMKVVPRIDEKPDTTACADFPDVASWPLPELDLKYNDTTLDRTKTSQPLDPTLTPAGSAVTYTVAPALPAGFSFDSSTGKITGPASWPTGVTGIAAGLRSTCASLSDGTGTCWGSNQQSALGNGGNDTDTSGVHSTPTAILTPDGKPLTGITKIAMNTASLGGGCALINTGKIYCWGYNGYRQLGDGTVTTRPYAQPVKSNASTDFTGATDISVGQNFACAITTAATAYCWGQGINGQLGYTTSSPTQQGYPVQVLNLTGVTQISTGNATTCAVANGAAYCWGSNSDYNIGDGTNSQRNIPTAVSGLSTGVRAISAGYGNTCAVMNSGAVMCWGKSNATKQISPTGTYTTSTPVEMTPAGGDAKDVVVGSAAYSTTICVISATGALRCWGNSTSGQFGTGEVGYDFGARTPNGFSTGTNAVTVGGSHVCGLQSGALKCWGMNANGQLGDGTTTQRLTPVAAGSYTGLSGYPVNVTITATPTTPGDDRAAKSVGISITVR